MFKCQRIAFSIIAYILMWMDSDLDSICSDSVSDSNISGLGLGFDGLGLGLGLGGLDYITANIYIRLLRSC